MRCSSNTALCFVKNLLEQKKVAGQIAIHTSINILVKYTLISGTTSDVAGKMSATISMNTVRANMLVITKVILSPASDGRKNESRDKTEE